MSDIEFGAYLKGLWWYGHVGTIGSFYKTLSSHVIVGLKVLASKRGVCRSPIFDAANDPRVLNMACTRRSATL